MQRGQQGGWDSLWSLLVKPGEQERRWAWAAFLLGLIVNCRCNLRTG